MKVISSIVIPLIVLIIIFYGFKKRINVYDTFLEGAKEGTSSCDCSNGICN